MSQPDNLSYILNELSEDRENYFNAVSPPIMQTSNFAFRKVKDLENAFEDKESNVLDKLAEKEIAGIVSNLPPGYKKIFILYVIEGYNHREIAEILGCSESTSKSQFYRSRTRIQQLLKQSA